MRLYRDDDADVSQLAGRPIAVIGYGNQGQAQAMNLRDSGLEVLIGNREDEAAVRAREDRFPVLSISGAAAQAEIVMLLIPDEVAPAVFEAEIAPGLAPGDVLVFASGYNVAFGFLEPPLNVDVVMVAPRMIGAGVRDLYLAGQGFPSFIGIAQDYSGQARAIALALAKGIGSTRAGVVEVTFAQEAELDLFTEQCFGPAFGHVLTTAVNLLIDEGYPPEAVLLELYMSGELAYTLGKIAELGLVEQSRLHSRTSQYGSMSRGMRFILPEIGERMREGLAEIQSGRFAQEWAAEEAAGAPTLEILRQVARSLPLYQMEQALIQALHGEPGPLPGRRSAGGVQALRWARAEAGAVRQVPGLPAVGAPPGAEGAAGHPLAGLRLWWARLRGRSAAPADVAGLDATQLEQVLRRFLASAVRDPELQRFSQGRQMTTHYLLSDVALQFYIRFQEGQVTASLGAPDSPAEVRLETQSDILDGLFTGRVHAMRAAMTGQLSFGGDSRLAISIQTIQDDLKRLYTQAREGV
jgi:ketol-acid reductoisomerase